MTSPLQSFARRGTVLVASLATAALGLAVSPVSADVPGGSSISGTVTDDNGDPLERITVTAETAYGARSATAFTDVDGRYDLTGLPAGSYVLEFSDRENFEYVAEFYDDAATFEEATLVTAAGAAPFPAADAELATASRIDGTLTGQAGAIEGAFVDIFKQVGGEWEYLNYEGDGAFTDEGGHYELSGLAAGDYRLGFGAEGHAPEFHEDAATVEAAQTVGLAGNGDNETVDAYLDLTSSITGTMTDATGGPAVGGQVNVWGGTEDEGNYYGSALADEDGNYVVADLAAGSYVVEFDYDDGDDYFHEYWDDAASFVAATPVVVEADGAVTDEIDAAMDDKTVAQVQVVTLPSISGVPKVGSTLTADPGTWDQPGATFDYEWETYEEGQQHTDFLATGRTYVPTADIVGQQIWVTVIASAPGAEDGYASSEPVGPVAAAPVGMPPPVVTPPVVTTPLTKVDDAHKPQVTGAKKVGSTLKAKAASWVPAGAKVKYQWLVNGKVVKNATKAKLKLLAKFAGKKVSVKVTATSPGGLPVSVVTKVGRVGKGRR